MRNYKIEIFKNNEVVVKMSDSEYRIIKSLDTEPERINSLEEYLEYVDIGSVLFIDYNKIEKDEANHIKDIVETRKSISFYEINKRVKIMNSLTLMYDIIDDISTYGDIAKDNDKLFRKLTEKRIIDLSKSSITTDGYDLNFKNLQ